MSPLKFFQAKYAQFFQIFLKWWFQTFLVLITFLLSSSLHISLKVWHSDNTSYLLISWGSLGIYSFCWLGKQCLCINKHCIGCFSQTFWYIQNALQPSNMGFMTRRFHIIPLFFPGLTLVVHLSCHYSLLKHIQDIHIGIYHIKWEREREIIWIQNN